MLGPYNTCIQYFFEGSVHRDVVVVVVVVVLIFVVVCVFGFFSFSNFPSL